MGDSMLQNAQVALLDALQGLLHELVIPHVVLICHLSDSYAFVQMLMCSARDGSRDHRQGHRAYFLLQETCLLCRSTRPLHGCSTDAHVVQLVASVSVRSPLQ